MTPLNSQTECMCVCVYQHEKIHNHHINNHPLYNWIQCKWEQQITKENKTKHYFLNSKTKCKHNEQLKQNEKLIIVEQMRKEQRKKGNLNGNFNVFSYAWVIFFKKNQYLLKSNATRNQRQNRKYSKISKQNNGKNCQDIALHY